MTDRSALTALLVVCALTGCGSSGNGVSHGMMDAGTSSSGAGNSGAAGAPATTPRPVVGSCSALPTSGMWEEITPQSVIDSQALVLDPVNVGTVWLGASTSGTSPSGTRLSGPGGVYKSTDCGATWTHVNTGMNGAAIDMASIWSLIVDYTDPSVIYVVGAYGPQGLWKSTNGGVDWVQLFPANSQFAQTVAQNWVGSVSMDPVNHLHLVVGTHNNCTGDFAPTCGAESSDGGMTWMLFKTTFLSAWAEQTGPYVIDDKTWVYATVFNGLWLTQDHGATWKNVTPANVLGVTGGEYTHRPIWRDTNGAFYLPSIETGGVLTSPDGVTWSLLAGAPGGDPVGFTIAGGRAYLGDRNSLDYRVSSSVPPTDWTSLPSPAAGTGEGAVYLEYDDTHHVLYSSNFEGRLWRLVTP
jgi:hypothetical protein